MASLPLPSDIITSNAVPADSHGSYSTRSLNAEGLFLTNWRNGDAEDGVQGRETQIMMRALQQNAGTAGDVGSAGDLYDCFKIVTSHDGTSADNATHTQFFITDGAATPAFNADAAITIKSDNSVSFGALSSANLILLNETGADTDGARDTNITFKGTRADTTVDELSKITVSHDGTGADSKGKIVWSVNNGTSLTSFMTVESDGSVTWNGTTTSVEHSNLEVTDANITLGAADTPTDVTADGGGITLKGATDKTIVWTDATDTWDFNQSVNVASGLTYRINDVEALSSTTLTLSDGTPSSAVVSLGGTTTGAWRLTVNGSGALVAEFYNGSAWVVKSMLADS